MKIFSAGIATETNTFASAPTGAAAWGEHGVHGRGGPDPDNEFSPFVEALRRLAAEEGHTLAQGLAIHATPGGTTPRRVYEALRDELLAGLRSAGPVDAVILPLHGAMVAEGYPDCEGDLIEHVRTLVGPSVPIGVELDLHCHFTERMRRHADVIVAFKAYPHTDVVERLHELWRLTLAAARGEIRPLTSVHDCRMVGLWHTTREPMAGFVREMQAAEGRDGVLSVSLGHGFPYGDVPEAGAKLWVVSDARIDAGGRYGAALAARLGRRFQSLREATRTPTRPLVALLDRLASPDAPLDTVVADTADNAGGGASSDSTFVLRGLVERGIGDVAIGAFWDVLALQIVADAGPGATLDLRLGGKCGPASGDPLDLRVTVMALAPAHTQTGLGARHDCGLSAWLRHDLPDGSPIDIVLVEKRQQVYGPDLFTGLGIGLAGRRAVVVKSSQHFHAAFAPRASQVLYVSTPGLMRDDFENIPYRHRDGLYWPRVADPWQEGAL